MTDRQQQLIDRMRNGEKLILTWQTGSFLLGDGRAMTHFYHSEIAPLLLAGVIKPLPLVGTPPGGHYPYELTDAPTNSDE